jgi:hypothetical protein
MVHPPIADKILTLKKRKLEAPVNRGGSLYGPVRRSPIIPAQTLIESVTLKRAFFRFW